MAQHPLLMFPTYSVGKRPPGPPRPNPLHKPGRVRQVENLGPKFDTLRKAFEAERLALQADPHGLDPDFVLVIETRGSIEQFQRAAQNIGMDWMGEIDLEDLEPDDDFWKPHDKTGARTDKTLNGRLYLGMTNQKAMSELLRLWELYRNGQDPETGKRKWRDLFDHAKDIRRWGARDRLRPELLDDWREAGDAPSVPFRLELWFNPDGATQETALRRAIQQAGGEVLAAARIEAIRFHALKGRIPRAVAQAAIAFDAGGEEHALAELFRHNEVRYFLPEAQGVVSLAPEAEAGPAAELPPAQDLEPVVALLDGPPIANHHWLDGRVRVNDPDDLLARYQAHEMLHGTAMASLILHDELDAHAPPLTRPIYCRPILEPDKGSPGREHVPETAFAEDRVHRAVVEMFDGEAAPGVRIVNLSIGEEAFHDVLSPWARLIDWLAFKYRLLFCVSAGNQSDAIETGMPDAEFQALPDPGKVAVSLRCLGDTLDERALLSPGEAINALTVGAQHHDRSTIPYLANRVDLLPDAGLPSPLSRLGPGYRKAVKPDLLLPGGRQLFAFKGSNGRYAPNTSPLAPGQQVAAPDPHGTGDLGKVTHTRGTSNATALASRAAARFHDILQSLRPLPGGERIDRDTTAPLLKALLVHGASWPEQVETLSQVIPVPNRLKRRAIARFYGYGITDPVRVEACTDQRATVLGCGLLAQDQAHEYAFPLPADLSGKREWRRLTITLAWLSPVNHRHRAYRKAKLNFAPPTAELALGRRQANWQQVQNGTVQHEILEGDQARAFMEGDALRIRILAQADSQQDFDEEVPYGLVVTLEVKEGCGLRIYEQVRERLAEPIWAEA